MWTWCRYVLITFYYVVQVCVAIVFFSTLGINYARHNLCGGSLFISGILKHCSYVTVVAISLTVNTRCFTCILCLIGFCV